MTSLKKLFTQSKALSKGQIVFIDQHCESLKTVKNLKSLSDTMHTNYQFSKFELLPSELSIIILRFAILGEENLTKANYKSRDFKVIQSLRNTSRYFRYLINISGLGSNQICWIKYNICDCLPNNCMHNLNHRADYTDKKLTEKWCSDYGQNEYKVKHNNMLKMALAARIEHLSYANPLAIKVLNDLEINEHSWSSYHLHSVLLKNDKFDFNNLKRSNSLCFALIIIPQLEYKIEGLDLANNEHIEVIKNGASNYLLDMQKDKSIKENELKEILDGIYHIPTNRKYIRRLENDKFVAIDWREW